MEMNPSAIPPPLHLLTPSLDSPAYTLSVSECLGGWVMTLTQLDLGLCFSHHNTSSALNPGLSSYIIAGKDEIKEEMPKRIRFVFN